MRACTICLIIVSFLATRRSVISALRSHARVHANWHAFVLTTEIAVIVGMRLADEGAGVALGVGNCRMCEWCLCCAQEAENVSAILPIWYRVCSLCWYMCTVRYAQMLEKNQKSS
jgi:hypothetical protein